MQAFLTSILNHDNDKLSKLVEGTDPVYLPVEGGFIKFVNSTKTTNPKQDTFTFEFEPDTSNHQRELTKREITRYLSLKGSNVGVDDAMWILVQLRRDQDKHGRSMKGIAEQYAALSHPMNPIYIYEGAKCECPSWYKKRYER